MGLYVNAGTGATSADKAVALDDLLLTTDLPTTGGSKMLADYKSLFAAEAVERLGAAGYGIAGKANTGEFGVDLLGESSAFGACTDEAGMLTSAVSEIVARGDACAAVSLDVNGTPRRAAALSGQVCVKPTYGTVSRFGTIAVACSGEALAVTARSAADCARVLDVIAGHDDKDGTSLPEEQCARVKSGAASAPIARVGIARGLAATADDATCAHLEACVGALSDAGIEVADLDASADDVIALSNIAWNILMSAELCNNVSRFDGVKYGHRTQDYETIGELYTNSRTEGFGDLVKTLILFGSEALSSEKYDAVYDKALRVRRLVVEAFGEAFASCGAVLMPACAQRAYAPEDVAADLYLAMSENRFTAPATISGLPSVVVGGMQLVGPAFSDGALLDLAGQIETAAAAKEVR